ncbi:MAG: GGDEF domain-containing protein [Halioglobus sp.]|nr:GGDEF domain-containing protein [Halioglobus sp.]
MAFILRFFDYFLPESLNSNPRHLMRGYVLVGIIFTNIILCLLCALGILFFLELEDNLKIALALDAACLLGYVASLWLLKQYESYVLCGNFILGILVLVQACGVSITGGYLDSPISQLVLQITLMAFLLLGLRLGIIWLGITIAISLLGYYGSVNQVGYIQLLQSDEVIQAMRMMLQFTLVFLVGGVLVVYETLHGLLEKELQEEKTKLEHWASHDDLTGVANRFEFFRRLRAHIDEAGERKQNVGVVYIDLDGFKPVNDTHGHHIGDEALRTIAERIQHAVRLSDTTARIGGDEFGLILPGIHVPRDIEFIIPKVMNAIRKPIRMDDLEVVIDASCGVSIFPNHSQDYNDLCRYADTAMYRAKSNSDSYLVYNNQMVLQPQ